MLDKKDVVTYFDDKSISSNDIKNFVNDILSEKVDAYNGRDEYYKRIRPLSSLNNLAFKSKKNYYRKILNMYFSDLQYILLRTDDFNKMSTSTDTSDTRSPNIKRRYAGVKNKNQSAKRLKIITPQQRPTRLGISLAQLQAGNNSQKLKNEIRQLLYSLYRSKKLSKNIYENLIKTIQNGSNIYENFK